MSTLRSRLSVPLSTLILRRPGTVILATALFATFATAGARVAFSRSLSGRGEGSVSTPSPREYGRPKSTPHPGDNRPTPARVALGKALFFDPRLSRSQIMSCATCHNPSFSWGDGNARAVGHGMQVLGRRTPTILNLAWAEALFWDGRAATLEEQALGPIAAAGEMNLPLDSLTQRLRSIPGYRALFAAAYPGEEIGPRTAAKAIATFERTVVSGMAPFDRWVAGDSNAVSAEARHGFAVFTGKGNCAVCHSGWRFTDDSFHDIGLVGSDSGRVRIINVEGTEFAFKTPTLRNVASRAPYMHDGSEATLEDVIELYDRGGRVHRASLSPEIKRLRLTAVEKRALVAFLHTLTSADVPVTIPVLPR
jgi:cytochrome c peroxidase